MTQDDPGGIEGLGWERSGISIQTGAVAGYRCSKFGNLFSPQDYLHRHVKNHADLFGTHFLWISYFQVSRQVQLQATGAAGIQTGAVAGYRCSRCEKLFSTQDYLDRHVKTHGDTSGVKQFKCPHCSYSTDLSKDLKRHMLTHTGERPHKCLTCGKGFTRKSNLKRHQRVHTGENPYRCEECGRSFNQQQHLTRHMLTHSGQKPYKCEHCDMRSREAREAMWILQNHSSLSSISDLSSVILLSMLKPGNSLARAQRKVIPNMPRGSGKKAAQKSTAMPGPSRDEFGFEKFEEEVESQTSHRDEETPILPKTSKKRSYLDEEEEEEEQTAGPEGNFGGEMKNLLESFGADISKTLSAKRKRLEMFTHSAVKASNHKVENTWMAQHSERTKLSSEYQTQVQTVMNQWTQTSRSFLVRMFMTKLSSEYQTQVQTVMNQTKLSSEYQTQVQTVMNQWDSDIGKFKEQEEKLQNLFKQQQKLFQQQRVIQSQRLKTLRQLHDQYTKGMDELEHCHQDQQGSMQAELRKEMALLQKKILMDTTKQDLTVPATPRNGSSSQVSPNYAVLAV
ncbi:SYCP3 [Branchiostoma lanceolatum]|uniref:SYCP3 protein n=1 Tax=Branchiostoma lanceolatum TaxID=7740 RepID=A0A8K0EPU0_BRALA|nr:SYCP3 [Branchiostoma lanceolatum]